MECDTKLAECFAKWVISQQWATGESGNKRTNKSPRNEDKTHVISLRQMAVPSGRELDYLASSLQEFVSIGWSDNRKTDIWLTDTPQNRMIIGSTKNRFLYGDCIIRTCRYWAKLDTTKYQKCPQAKRTRKAQVLQCTISEFPKEAQRAETQDVLRCSTSPN